VGLGRLRKGELAQVHLRRVWGKRALLGRRQLPWPVDDNYLGRFDLSREGPEARATVIS
jgi:hypothetical protein